MNGLQALGLLLAHLAGDYVLQSHWMAQAKTSRWWPALVHAGVYTACYLPVTQSPLALLMIGGTHAVIDRHRLARHVIWAKNHLAPVGGRPQPWSACTATGYDPDVPAWLAVGLLIAADNTLHLVINVVAVVWL